MVFKEYGQCCQCCQAFHPEIYSNFRMVPLYNGQKEAISVIRYSEGHLYITPDLGPVWWGSCAV